MNYLFKKKLTYNHFGASLVIGIAILSALVVIIQLGRWQIVYYDYFQALASSQIVKKETMETKRGTIYSADGVVMAVDVPSWTLVISVRPSDFEKFKTEELPKIKEFLINKLEIDPDVLNEKLKDNNKFTYLPLIEGLDSKERELIESQKFWGVYFKSDISRFYPNGTIASNVLGFIGKDSKGNPIGRYGLEGFFWGDIKGKRGYTKREKDLKGEAILSKDYDSISSRQGKNLELTIRLGVQQKVENILKEAVKEYKADSATAIIMNPHTGEIIAMASVPNYDPNFYSAYYKTNKDVFKNTAVANIYEYGSVQKPLTIAIGMQTGKITEDTICHDTGKLKVLDKTIYNWAFKKYGYLKPKDVLLHSDNVCSAQFGLKIGAKNMYEYLRKLGFGSLTGVGLQDEETSFLKPYQKWLKTDTATIAFGQTISATPLQVVSAMSTIANKGVRMQPYLVRRIYNSEVDYKIEPVVAEKVFDAKIADSVLSMMEYAAMSKPMSEYKGKYRIAGKTGTAQMPDPKGGYYKDRVNVTYIGIVPADDPQIIMLVKLENPRKYKLASQVAVPTWKKIFNAVKDDLGIKRAR